MEAIHTLDGVRVDTVPAPFALYPYGGFTSFVVVDGTVLGWRRHVERLARAAHEMWGHDLDRHELQDRLRNHLGLYRGTPASVRVTVYPNSLTISAPEEATGCRILISSTRAEFPFQPIYEFSVCTVAHTRTSAHLKTTDLFDQIFLRRRARLAGFDDALFTRGDDVLEGTTWSVMVWSEGTVLTPESDVLSSITVEHLTTVARTLGWTVEFTDVDLAAVHDAQLVLGVNINNPARAVSRVDGRDLSVDVELLDQITLTFNDLPRQPLWGPNHEPTDR